MSPNVFEMYDGTDLGAAWLKHTASFVEGQKLVFAMNAKKLPEAFADCMQLIAEPLQMVETDHFKGMQRRTFLGVLGLAYQLLQSAWQANQEGRMAAASHQWRSIDEAADYLLALWWDEEFAIDYHDAGIMEQKKSAKAMKIVRAKVNGMQEGKGDERHANRSARRKSLQVMSHLSAQSAGLNFAPAAGKGAFFVPEGYNGADNVLHATYLLEMAKQILLSLRLTIQDFMPDKWKDDVKLIMAKVQAFQEAINHVIEQQQAKSSRTSEAAH